ncbi:FAD-dependent oxidoreductase [Candidatus Margulisiibacteriota bacterium]
MLYDLIIVGAGPAGITAAVYAARQKLKTLILTGNIGGQTAWSGNIENYTGFQFISGIELAAIFEDHVRAYTDSTITIKTQEKVQKITSKNRLLGVETQNHKYSAKTVIISCGKTPNKLNVPGEKEFKNKGVTYCATCDGPVFAGKDVAVIGGANSALDAVLQLTDIAHKVYLINVNNQLSGDEVMIEKVSTRTNVELLNATKTKEIKGKTYVNSLIVQQADQEKEIDLQGIFIEIGLTPNSNLKIDVATNQAGEIIVNNKNETNVPGLFAAGDVTDVPAKQIIVAAGEGAKACLGVIRYLNSLDDSNQQEIIATQKGATKMNKWECVVCGYIYNPAQNNNIAFEALPEDWVCPECGVGKDQFQKL